MSSLVSFILVLLFFLSLPLHFLLAVASLDHLVALHLPSAWQAADPLTLLRLGALPSSTLLLPLLCLNLAGLDSMSTCTSMLLPSLKHISSFCQTAGLKNKSGQYSNFSTIFQKLENKVSVWTLLLSVFPLGRSNSIISSEHHCHQNRKSSKGDPLYHYKRCYFSSF